ncbi:MAG: TlpA disulfide reductase family protein [Ferruginibacter sp.]
MVKNIKDGLTGFLLLIATQATSQSQLRKSLEPGDKVPDIVFEQLFKRSNNTLTASHIQEKLIILDFWNVWCSACLTSMPKMDSLQKMFGDKLQIILVTTNKPSEVKKALAKPYLKQVDLPIIAEDSVLSSVFTYVSVPHHVWINANGIVEYISYPYNTNEKNIKGYLSGNKPLLAYKNDQTSIDISKPLWAKENESFSNHIKYYSYATGWISENSIGLKTRFVDTIKGTIGLRFINTELLSLFQTAFGGFDGGIFKYQNRIVLNVSDSALFRQPPNENDMDKWNNENLVSYEIAAKFSSKDDLYKIMQSDLKRYFGYDAVIEKKRVNCLTLIRTSEVDKIKSKKSVRKIVRTDSSFVIENETISKGLLERLRIANASLSTPIIDETGYPGKIDLILNCSLSDIASLKQELQKYDLNLVLEEKDVDMLVITDKNACCN